MSNKISDSQISLLQTLLHLTRGPRMSMVELRDALQTKKRASLAIYRLKKIQSEFAARNMALPVEQRLDPDKRERITKEQLSWALYDKEVS